MELFSKHAKRSTIQVDDVKLVVSILNSLKIFFFWESPQVLTDSDVFLCFFLFLCCENDFMHQCVRRCPDAMAAIDDFVEKHLPHKKRRAGTSKQAQKQLSRSEESAEVIDDIGEKDFSHHAADDEV